MRRFAIRVAWSLLVALAAFVAAPSTARACDILLEDAGVSVLSVDAGAFVVRDSGFAARSLVVSRSVFGGVVLLEERAVVVRRQRARGVRLFSRPRAARRVIVIR